MSAVVADVVAVNFVRGFRFEYGARAGVVHESVTYACTGTAAEAVFGGAVLGLSNARPTTEWARVAVEEADRLMCCQCSTAVLSCCGLADLHTS